MLSFAKIYFLLFGIITIASGVTGYVKASSLPSLIAGGVLGALLVLGAFLLPENWRVGLGLALFVSIALAGRFTPAVMKGVYNPGAYLVPLSIIGLILGVLAFLNPGR